MKTSRAISLYINSCQARGLSSQTIRWYSGILRSFACMFPSLPDRDRDCEKFIKSCKAGDERRHGYFRTLRVFYNFAEKRLGLPNSISLLKEPRRSKKLPKPVPFDGLIQLVSFPQPGRIKAALLFLIDTGARVGELVRIQTDDFIETPWGVYLVKLEGKTGPRIIPVSIEAHDAIIKYLPFNIKANRMSRIIARAFRDAHVPGSAHSLRHSFATYWEGADISLLQNIMGHANISTTMLYRRVQYELLALAHKKYSPLKKVLSQAGNTGII